MNRIKTLLLLILSITTAFAQTRIYEGIASIHSEDTPLAAIALGKVTVDDLGNRTYKLVVTIGEITLLSDMITSPKVANNTTVVFNYKMDDGEIEKITFTPELLTIGSEAVLQFNLVETDAFGQMLKKLRPTNTGNISPALRGDIKLTQLCKRPFGVKIDAGEAFTAATIIKSAKNTYGWNVAQFDRTGIGFKWENLNGLSLFGYPLSYLKTDTSLTTGIWKGIIMGEAIYPTQSDGAKLRKRITSVMLAAGWTQYENSHNRISFYNGTAMASFWFVESSRYKGKYECGFQSDIFESADIVRYRVENGVG